MVNGGVHRAALHPEDVRGAGDQARDESALWVCVGGAQGKGVQGGGGGAKGEMRSLRGRYGGEGGGQQGPQKCVPGETRDEWSVFTGSELGCVRLRNGG